MTALLSAELLKLRTIRATWGYVIVVLALAALVNTGNLGATSDDERRELGFQERLFLDASFPAAILAVLLGILLFTNEFRHGTITRTCSSRRAETPSWPRRSRRAPAWVSRSRSS